jgi:dolichol kinase
MTIFVVVAAYGLLFMAGEVATRRRHVSPELTRQYIHLLSGVAAVLFAIWLTREELIGLSVLFLGGLLISQRLSLLQSIHQVRRTTWGELFFPAGIALAALLYLPHSPHLYSLSVLIMALSDPLANLIGSRTGRGRLLFGKSLLGSTVFFTCTLVLSLFFLQPVGALLVAALATLFEALSPYGSDNLTIIPAVALAALL